MTAFSRYWLLQLPGWAVLALVAVALRVWTDLPPWLGVALVAGWIVKDVALYPFLKDGYRTTASKTPAELLVGRRGVVERQLDPDGTVRVRGELWGATLRDPAATAARGTPVRVEAVEGPRLRVASDEAGR